jgi:hypothetical protein
MHSIMLVSAEHVVTRAATAGYTPGRHRHPAPTAPVAGTVFAGFRKNEAMAAHQTTDDDMDRQLEQNTLGELIDEYTRAEGEFTAEELAAARIALYGTEGQDAEQ